jgi:hypothetical protein
VLQDARKQVATRSHLVDHPALVVTNKIEGYGRGLVKILEMGIHHGGLGVARALLDL